MTYYKVHYRNGEVVDIMMESSTTDKTLRVMEIRRLARNKSDNRTGAIKIERPLTGEVYWQRPAETGDTPEEKEAREKYFKTQRMNRQLQDEIAAIDEEARNIAKQGDTVYHAVKPLLQKIHKMKAALELCKEDGESQARADAPGVHPDWYTEVVEALK